MRHKYLMILASCLLLHFFKCSFDTRNLRHGTLWIVCSFSCHLYLNIQPYPTDTIRATMLAKASYFTHLGACFLQETSCLPCSWQRSIIFWENPWWVSFSCLTTRDLNDTLNETRSFRNPNIFNKSVTMNGDRFTSRMGWQAARDGFLSWNQKLMWGVWSVPACQMVCTLRRMSNPLYMWVNVLFEVLKKMQIESRCQLI